MQGRRHVHSTQYAPFPARARRGFTLLSAIRTHDKEAPQKLLVYTTLSRAPGVQGIYRASISNICSAVAGTAYVVCAEHFILWVPRLQLNIMSHLGRFFVALVPQCHILGAILGPVSC